MTNVSSRSSAKIMALKAKNILTISIFASSAGLLGCANNNDSATTSSVKKMKADDKAVNSVVSTKGLAPLWPKITSAVKRDEAIEQRVAKLVAAMSNEQKVGQILQPELKEVTPADVKEFHIGSILNGGGTFANNDKYATIHDWVDVAERFYQASMDTSDGGMAIPVIWGTDAVHGHNNVIGATLFPHNIGLGATNNPELLKKIGEVTAREVAATGITWVFAPTVAAPRDDRWGRTYEGYSENPQLIFSYAGKIVEGMQGAGDSPELFSNDKVVSTVKHFVGDGGTQNGIDRADTQVSEKELFDIHAQGYVSALQSGAQTVMASFNSWNGLRMHGNKYLLTDVLKNKMGFDGFVVGDWNGHGFVEGCKANNCPESVNAGVDMLMAPDADWKVLYANTLAQVNEGIISQERINDAVTRILRVKMRSGLFERGPKARSSKENMARVGSQEHREIARQAVRESLVLLKNKNKILPLNKKQHVLIAGDAADNIGKQSGGWTISWQGTGNVNSDFPGGTSIFDGIKKAVEGAGGTVNLSVDGSYKSKPDVAIVVFGENPYAEMQGDLMSLEYQAGKHTDLMLLRKLKADGIRVVSVFLSGRPLWVNAELNASDAFVAAWLPGSEGAAISDVLFKPMKKTEVAYDFVGRLPFSWPAKIEQTVLNVGDDDYTPLFAYGAGLSINDVDTLGDDLPAVITIAPLKGTGNDVELFNNRVMEPWRMVLSDADNKVVPVSGTVIKTKNVRVESVDKNVQHDSRKVVWLGNGMGRISLMANSAQDLQEYSTKDSWLSFDAVVSRHPEGAVFYEMLCGHNCKGKVDLGGVLSQLSLGKWKTLHVNLSCLAQASVDFSKIETVFSIATQSPLDLTISNIRLSKAPSVYGTATDTRNCLQPILVY